MSDAQDIAEVSSLSPAGKSRFAHPLLAGESYLLYPLSSPRERVRVRGSPSPQSSPIKGEDKKVSSLLSAGESYLLYPLSPPRERVRVRGKLSPSP